MVLTAALFILMSASSVEATTPEKLTDDSLTTNATNINEGDVILITGQYDNSGQTSGTWNISINSTDTNAVQQNINLNCETSEGFKFLSLDTSGCTETCTDNGDGVVDLAFAAGASNQVIKWTIEACGDASDSDPYTITTLKLSGGASTLNADTASITVNPVGGDNPPTWSDPQINVTDPVTPKDVINLSVAWQDDTALNYWIFEWNATGADCQGGFSNVTEAGFIGIENVSWTEQTVPAACNGTQIGWRFYANDSANQFNVTDMQLFNVRAFGTLTINLTNPNPLDTKDVSVNTTFEVNVTVTCDGPTDATCGVVNCSVRYNATTQEPDRVMSITQGDSPFYITDVHNTLTCGLLLQGQACQLNWTVNATTPALYVIDANASSVNFSAEIAANNTDNTLINITSVLDDLSFTVSFPSLGCTLGNGSLDGSPDCELCAFRATDTSGGTIENRTNCEGQNSTLGFYEFRNTGNVNLNWTMQLNESLDTSKLRHKVSINDSGYEAGCSANNPPPTNNTCMYVEDTTAKVIQKDLVANAVQMAWAWADFTNAFPVDEARKNITHTSIKS